MRTEPADILVKDRDLVAGYVEDNSDDSRCIPPVKTDADLHPDSKFLTDASSQNRTRLSTLAAVCDRYLISDYARAAITTVGLTYYGVIRNADRSKVIGLHQPRDAWQKYRLKRQKIQMASFEKYDVLVY